jgi:DNA (cytosine-5)-methyltransferase 1
VKPAAHISLFAGIGSIDLAAEREGIPTIITAEIDDWCRDLLHKRFPKAEHLSDVAYVTTRQAGPFARPLLVSGGFPCPGISNAGTKQGLADPRSGLWSEFDRVIRDLQPEYVLIENVPALRKRGMDVILNDLYYAGYNAWWDCFPASYFGAPHERDRIWIQARRQDVIRFGGDAPLTDEAPLLGVLDRIPRAGRFIDGNLYEEPPQAPLSAVRRGSRHPLALKDRWTGTQWPTPTRADGTGGPGTSPKRTGGMNLRTAVVNRGFRGSLSAAWVEWLMGLPIGWTDQRSSTGMCWNVPWGSNRIGRPVSETSYQRRQRLMALGNATVPRVAQHAIQELLRRP